MRAWGKDGQHQSPGSRGGSSTRPGKGTNKVQHTEVRPLGDAVDTPFPNIFHLFSHLGLSLLGVPLEGEKIGALDFVDLCNLLCVTFVTHV